MAIDMTALDAKINELVSNPKVNYSIGDKSVSAGDYLRQLMELRDNLVATPELALEFIQLDSDIELSGNDRTQFTVL